MAAMLIYSGKHKRVCCEELYFLVYNKYIRFLCKATGRFPMQLRQSGGFPTKGGQHCQVIALQALYQQGQLQKRTFSARPQAGTAFLPKALCVSNVFWLTGRPELGSVHNCAWPAWDHIPADARI